MNQVSDIITTSTELFLTKNFSSPSSHQNHLLKRLNTGGSPGVLLTVQVYARAEMISDFLNNQLRGTLIDLLHGFEQRDRDKKRAQSNLRMAISKKK